MNLPQYRVFVCIKQRAADGSGGCCCGSAGALEIYGQFQSEIAARQLGDRVEVRQSGCLDRCEAGTVVAVYRASWQNFSWLPDQIQRKVRKLLFPNRHLYGHLTCEDVPAIVKSHFIDGHPLKRNLI